MADGDDDFEVDALSLADQVVQLGLAFRLQHRLVEVEERVGGEGDLLARRSGDGTAAGGRGRARAAGAGAGAGGGAGAGAAAASGRHRNLASAVAGVQ